MDCYFKKIRWFLAAICMLPAMLSAAGAVSEHAMKSAFLYNFVLFTEWPIAASENLNLCVVGSNNIGSALNSIDGKEIKSGRRLIIRQFGLKNIHQCQIVYINEAVSDEVSKSLSELSGLPILIISDTEGFPTAMVRMWLENKRLVFEVNQHAAQRAQLNFSSKMLNLARRVQ